jgi:hypothetical protein
MSGVAGWQEEPGSDDDFDGDVPSQAGPLAVHDTVCGAHTLWDMHGVRDALGTCIAMLRSSQLIWPVSSQGRC